MLSDLLKGGLSRHQEYTAEDFYRDHPECKAEGRIETSYWAKPIPDRDHDWQATHEEYDPESRLYGRVGHGATKAEAITDLLEQMEAA